MASFESLAQCVISGNISEVKIQVRDLIDGGSLPLEIINKGLIEGMNIVGTRFKTGDMFVPEVLMAAKSMAAGVDIVRPLINDKDMPSHGKIIIGTVKGDLHDIGKNLVAMMLESAGFTVYNIGIDIAPIDFIKAAKETDADIIAISALLTTTMMAMKETIDIMKKEGIRSQFKVIVGGAPISEEFANDIGADGYAPDAATACDVCKSLLNK